jgi:fatty acid-binding protein DegV
VLDIKPVLRIDQYGALVISEKIRGRRRSMKALVDVTERRFTEGGPLLVVAHGDSPEDAAMLAEMLTERLGFAPTLMCEVGPVIGSHVGPGMLAVSFLGTERTVQ